MVSDSAYKGVNIDKSGPELVRLVSNETTETGKILKGQIQCTDIVPDSKTEIKEKLIFWSDHIKVNVILTTGGTGFSKRDVTPEATKAVIDKETPGIFVAMLAGSLRSTSMAMLSRATCGIRNKTLIINLPGSPKAARECLTIVAEVIPHAVDLIRDNVTKVKITHDHVQNKTSTDTCMHVHSHHEPKLQQTDSIPMRLRQSPYPMISVTDALEILKTYVKRQMSECVNIAQAHGRVLAVDLHSDYDLPPFRASIKDGYAVLASDGKGKRRVLGGIKAGSPTIGVTLVAGTCVRVNTGAPIPDDATAVVQVEDTKLLKSDNVEEQEIEIVSDVKKGQDIRLIGCDIRKGELILEANTKLAAAEVGLLAACGIETVNVIKQPAIGVLSTGDELVAVGESLKPGCIFDSNKITLLSVLKEQGFQPLDMGIAQDDNLSMTRKLEDILKQVDVLVTSGSVSMGDKDMLKPILQDHFKATIHFGRVNMKPGKPTTFATCTFEGKTKYFMCLPGNPVSATVTMHLFVLPLLKLLSGDHSKPVFIKTELTTSYKLDLRPEYARAILKWEQDERLPKAYSTGNQISSKLLSCKNANALLILPGRTSERTEMRTGDIVNALLLGFTSI